jgi:hypothetical protein
MEERKMANQFLSISAMLVMEKNLRGRLKELGELKNSVSHRTMWGSNDKVEEPTYDVKDVDKKMVEIHKALFKINQRIKETNAKTLIASDDIDYDSLMEAIQ